METITTTALTQIAERVPPGDNWRLTTISARTFEPIDQTIYESLTDVMNAYHIQAAVKPEAYRIEPMNGKVYIIQEIKTEKEVKRYNIYGDPI
jgi:hypothetical protein